MREHDGSAVRLLFFSSLASVSIPRAFFCPTEMYGG